MTIPSGIRSFFHSITQPLQRLREGYQLANETVERAKEGITEEERESARESSTPEKVYPQQAKRQAGASTLSMLLSGRRLGYSGSKTKIHIVRELSYGDGTFLCGVQKAAQEPLFIHHIAEEGLDLCKSCIKLAKNGAH